jgi:hypothetical protein
MMLYTEENKRLIVRNERLITVQIAFFHNCNVFLIHINLPIVVPCEFTSYRFFEGISLNHFPCIKIF